MKRISNEKPTKDLWNVDEKSDDQEIEFAQKTFQIQKFFDDAHENKTH